MIVSIHQPNYLPWLGYFSKIKQSDKFIIYDIAEFQHGNSSSVINRNKIKTLQGKALLLTVPVLRYKQKSLINQIRIDYTQPWVKKHLNSIKLNYSKGPFFKDVFTLLEGVLSKEYEYLSDLNSTLIAIILNYLEIKKEIYKTSSFLIEEEEKNLRLVKFCKSVNGTIYLSGNGAKKYNDLSIYSKENLELRYSNFKHPVYRQIKGEFISNLSILDCLFNVGKATSEFL